MPPKAQRKRKQKAPAQQRQARPARRPQPKKKAQGVPRGPSMGALSLMKLVNPWMGKGTKYPDSNASPSVSMQVFTVAALNPIAGTGYRSARIFPGKVRNLLFQSATEAGGIVSDWDVGVYVSCANYATLAANFAGYRVVSAGVKARYIGTALSNSGSIAVKKDVNSSFAATTPPLSATAFSNDNFYGVYRDGFSTIIRRCTIESEHYEPLDSLTELDGWENVSFFIAGAADDQQIQVEITQNLELLPLSNTLAAQMSTPAANDQPALRAAMSRAQITAGKTHPFR